MELYFREYGSPRSDQPTLVFLHGLFGSSVNWHSIARQFENEWHVLAPDLRNHGRSQHCDQMSYTQMAKDVADLLETLFVEQAIVIGHSMGGKVAITLAQHHPEKIAALVVADIAPVAYEHEFDDILAGFDAVELGHLRNRNDADVMMATVIEHLGIRQYLLQNLLKEEGEWRWRLNLSGIAASMDVITGFAPGCHQAYEGPALIIRGEYSAYVQDQHEPEIRNCLPAVLIETLRGVGHWIYAEDPEGFMFFLRPFLSQSKN
jgi:pimeloyl-ACP methyl ester carboxylesterase